MREGAVALLPLGYPVPEMPVIVSLLRGVNVGGHHKIKMDALRDLYESLGLRQAQTYIQSGNVICTAPARNLAKLANRIEDAIEKRFGFRCEVVLRTAAELREALARNPFTGRAGIDPVRLLVNFLACDPDSEGCAAVQAMDIAPEELHIDGRHLYVYFPDGIARPKLSWPKVGKALKSPVTGRNLSTVQKLLALAEQLEASQ
jgi:uncharacterized protein (DUF1697 family)